MCLKSVCVCVFEVSVCVCVFVVSVCVCVCGRWACVFVVGVCGLWSVCVFVVGVRVCVYGFFFLFCFESVISIPLHAARRAMAAAACRCPSQARNSSLFPPQVYPFPAPEPACAVIVGVSQRLLLPMSSRKLKPKTKEKKRVTRPHHPHT